MRQTWLKPSSKRKRVLVRKICPIDGCFATPKLLYNHLVYTHKLSRDSEIYLKAIKEAVPALPEEKRLRTEESSADEGNFIDFAPTALVAKEDEKIIKAIRVEASSLGLLNTDIYDSEDDEDFIISDSEDEASGQESEGNGENDTESSTVAEDCIDENNVVLQNTETEYILEEFSDWMASCDGGEKTYKSCVQNVKQVRQIIKSVDPKKQSLFSLFDRIKVRDTWYMPYRNSERKPGTIRSYCNSLRSLMEFLVISKIAKNCKTEDIRCMEVQAKAWAKRLNRESKRREFEKVYEDFDCITDPKEIADFQNSKPCREAIAVIGKFTDPKKGVVPMQADYTLVRDFLFWHLSLANGGRPGPIVDITLSLFRNARKECVVVDGKETECYTINIFKHKTGDTHGPAKIVFSAVLYNWFTIFDNNIRGRFYGLPKDANSPLFVAHTGNPITSSNCAGRITSLWSKGIKNRKNGAKVRMNNTLIRKSVTTHVRKHHSEMKDEVAHKLLHKPETAERYYNVIKRGENSTKISLFLSSIFKGQSHPGFTPQSNVEALDESEECSTRESKKWSEEDTNLLRECFADYSGNISMGIVKQVILQNKSLKKFEEHAKRVQDKVRYIKKFEKVDLQVLPEESGSEKLERWGIKQVCLFRFLLSSKCEVKCCTQHCST